MAQPPKGGLVRGHDKPIHRGYAIYFPGGVNLEPVTHCIVSTKNFQPARGGKKPNSLRPFLSYFKKKKTLQGTRDPETNIFAPEVMDGWNTIVYGLLGWLVFTFVPGRS